MPKTTPITRPLYFAAGATDLAVEKLRELPAEYKRLQLQARKLDPTPLRAAEGWRRWRVCWPAMPT